MKSRRRLLAPLVLLTVFLAGCAPGGGADYPEREITLVVPLAAGGSTDTVARILAEHLGRELGQPVVVDNQPGAGGVIATTRLARERPDGYTLQYSADTLFASEPLLRPDIRYSVEDFDFIRAVGGNSPTLTVREDSGWADLGALVATARAEQRRITYGHVGVGSSLQLAAERFFEVAGVDAQQIPFGGGGEALNALLAGDVDAYIAPETTIIPYVGEGVVPLAVASPERSAFLPDVPTMAELGYDVALDSLSGLYGPAGLPDEVHARLTAALDALAADDAFVAALTDAGVDVDMRGGAAVVEHIRATGAVYAQMLDAEGGR